MSAETFAERNPNNVQGRFYVDSQCLDCALCHQIAPDLFAVDGETVSSYVRRQPRSEVELALAIQAMEGCCVEAIRDDGDRFDWGR